MQKPNDVTDEQIAVWLQEIQDRRPHDPIMQMYGDNPHFQQSYCAGKWLGQQLDKAGIPKPERDWCVMANGQRCAAAPDPWEASQKTLQEALQGIFHKPGEKYSEQLIKEYEPTTSDKRMDVLRSFLSRGFNPDQVDHIADQLREHPKYEGTRQMSQLGWKLTNADVDKLIETYRDMWEQEKQ